LDAIKYWAAERSQRLQDALTLGNVAAVAGDHSDERGPVRTMKESGVGREFVGSRLDVVTEVADDVNGHIPRVGEKTAQDGVNRMGSELERSHHAEVPTSAAERPEQILVFRGIGGEHSAVGGDHLARYEVVDGHTVFANHPTDATTQRQATNTSLGHDAGGHSKTEDVSFAVEIT
jgi:hypothetical protein